MNVLRLLQPENGTARSPDEAREVARRIGYPVMVRPSYVLGGRSMEVVYDDADLGRWIAESLHATADSPVLIDRFLKDAIEVDVDLVVDREGNVLVGGVLEHIDEAGVHSCDAASTLPPHSLSPDLVERMKDQATALARKLGVVGLMNVQFAIQGKAIYLLEANPRASRTVPFVYKATRRPSHPRTRPRSSRWSVSKRRPSRRRTGSRARDAEPRHLRQSRAADPPREGDGRFERTRARRP